MLYFLLKWKPTREVIIGVVLLVVVLSIIMATAQEF